MKSGIALLLAVGFLAACATTDPSYVEGKRLLANGKNEEGLALLEKASRDNPRNPELRMEYISNRDVVVMRLIQQADSARIGGKYAEAEATYIQALRIDPDSARARAGYETIATDRRHAERLREAEKLFAKKDFAGTELRL